MTEPREISERYRLEKIVKSSRTGNVLRATDAGSGQPVIVKMVNLPGPAPELIARFERLGAALASGLDPFFPAVTDFGISTEGTAFLVCEPLEGRGFESLAGGRGLRVLALVTQVLDGLEALAERGLFHGNLSPDNLLVVRPQADGVKTFGLGTAYFRTPQAAAADSQNARYRAPEELSEPLPDPERWRSDLYSLALTTCRVLGAEITFADTPTPKVAIPTVLGFELKQPDALRSALESALRLQPAERPTLAQVRDGIRKSMGLPPAAERPRPAVPKAPMPASPLARASIEDTRPSYVPPPGIGTPGPQAPAAPPTLSALAGGDDLGDLPPLSSLPPMPALPQMPPNVLDRTTFAPSAAPPPFLAPADSGAPESGEALLSIDDLLNADLPPALPPAGAQPAASGAPPPPAAAGAGPSPAWAASAAASPTPTSRSGAIAPAAGPPSPPRSGPAVSPMLLIGGAVVLVAVVAGSWWFAGRREATPEPVAGAPAAASLPPDIPQAPATPAAPPAPALDPPAVRLAAAKTAADAGHDHEALVGLKGLTAADRQTLAPPDAAAVKALEERLTISTPPRVTRDLAAGLKSKDLTLLRDAVFDVTVLPTAAGALPPNAQNDLTKARQLAELYDRADSAAKAGKPLEALERFAELAKLLPGVRDSSGLRDRAAAAIEEETETILKEGKYDEAVAHLEPLARLWAERPGLKARLADIRNQQKAEKTVEAAIQDAAVAEKLKKPDDGLAALRRVKPTPHLELAYKEARERLEALLAQYDSNPPTIELRDGFLLDYDRGMVVNLSFRVQDDYKVVSVKLYARSGSSGKMVELPLEKDRASFTAHIPPSFHQNETVDFYAVASDSSGHQTFFGTKDNPQHLKRKKGFRET